MASRMYSSQRLEMIRSRSYEIWEREGQQEGKTEDYWLRAESEIDAECRAMIAGENTHMVLPLPRISRRPIRYPVEAEDTSESVAA